MKNFVLIYCFICFVSLVFADNFRENFQNPPDLACAETWYHFTTEMITKEGITADMEAMRDIGYKGAHVFATGGNVQNSVFKNPVAIMSPQWQEMMEHLGREAKRCGIKLGRHGSDLHRLNTWWKMGDAWVGYINKAQTLLQAGIAIKQILFVPPITAPNSNWKSKLNKSIVDEGFDYDICSVEDLGDILYVDNGKIRASKNGVSYNLLVVEGNNLNTIAKIKAIENLVADGANVLAERPVDSPSLSDNKGEFDELVERIWGGNEAIKKIGKGKLFKNGSPLSILRNMGVKPKCLAKNMLAICRTTGSHDIFYIVNTTKNSFNKNIFFNVESGKIPQLWDAYTGKIENITEYKRSNNEVEIPLYFSENDSKFIVFVEGKEQSTISVATSEKQNTKTCIEALDISNDWNVYFQKNRGAPDSIKLAKTQSLSQSQIDGVKYFSGIMLYEKEIEIPSDYIKENRKLILEFDKIYNIAQVEINGKFVQTLWKSPYRCDITKHLKVGKNIIKIKVANLWVNRIIGDSQYPYEPLQNWVIQGKTKSESKRITSSDWSSAWGKKDKLLESGIVGKVQIKACDVVPIKNN